MNNIVHQVMDIEINWDMICQWMIVWALSNCSFPGIAEGLSGRKSIPAWFDDVCFSPAQCFWLLGFQERYVCLYLVLEDVLCHVTPFKISLCVTITLSTLGTQILICIGALHIELFFCSTAVNGSLCLCTHGFLWFFSKHAFDDMSSCRYSVLEQEQVYGRFISTICSDQLCLPVHCVFVSAWQWNFLDDYY